MECFVTSKNRKEIKCFFSVLFLINLQIDKYKKGELMRNILDLFNGVSGGHLSIDKANIQHGKVFYSEINEYANKITKHHFPNDISLGDLNNWRDWDIDWSAIDLITAGFPCQSWSISGKQLGDKDPRGQLFWVTLDIIKHAMTKNTSLKFMLENVKMKSEFEKYITYHTQSMLGDVNKNLFNAAMLSAQNRERYFWTNFNVDPINEDRQIFIGDILEPEVDKKYHIAPSAIPRYLQENGFPKKFRLRSQKAVCMSATLFKGYGNDGCTVILIDERKPGFYRRLTPLECERLQGYEDNYTNIDGMSDTQRYKCIGNGWNIDVGAHVLSFAQ